MTGQTNNVKKLDRDDLVILRNSIKKWGKKLGFDHVGISDTNLAAHETYLNKWVELGRHGDMQYMHHHGTKRSRPNDLVPGTISIISVRMDYAPDDIEQSAEVLKESHTAYISRYAQGRDYHKVMRKQLKLLGAKISGAIGDFGYRVFTDSAPVLEKAIAEKAGLGWIGKHSNLIDSKTGSWFFLGELYTDLALPSDKKSTNHCGSCQQCITDCPTGAIVAPYQVDAPLCISYLTVESKSSIPEHLRPLIGNRIYGCDDCQLVCPWNKFAQTTRIEDYTPREQFKDRSLIELFEWSEQAFLDHTEGTAIRRIGHSSWQRNIAVAMGNALRDNRLNKSTQTKIIDSLRKWKSTHERHNGKNNEQSVMVAEHVDWAIAQQLPRQ